MVFRWIVNAGLLAIPIGTTIGVLVGIDAQRQASGQKPMFSGGDNGSSTGDGGLGNGGSGGGNGGGNGGGSTSDDNGISWNQYCQDSYGIPVTTKGQEYVLNPNQWGLDAESAGGMCMNVTTFNNGSYATDTTGPAFYVTWNYTAQPSRNQPVHAFPNIMIKQDPLPVLLKDVKAVELDVEWSYAVGNNPESTTNEAALTADALDGNVAVDMFLDSDKETSSNSSSAAFEIMVWFAQFGASTDPLGYTSGAGNGKVLTRNVNGTDFNMWYGENDQKQHVITYIATKTTTNFTGDLQQLLTRPSNLPAASTYPTDSDYLGHFSFGSEAFDATKNVTFNVPKFSIDIQT